MVLQLTRCFTRFPVWLLQALRMFVRLLYFCQSRMFSKNNERGKLIIPELKAREVSKGKSAKRQQAQYHQYGTDLKRQLDKSVGSDVEQSDSLHCSQCRARISQFVTKKPTHPIEKGTQTAHKPFLIDLIQEKVQTICQSNAKLSRKIQEKEDQLFEKQQEIAEIEDKFTSILLVLAQEVAETRKSKDEWYELKKCLESDSDTPAYLKALQFDC